MYVCMYECMYVCLGQINLKLKRRTHLKVYGEIPGIMYQHSGYFPYWRAMESEVRLQCEGSFITEATHMDPFLECLK